jgi:hypothetical protein
MEHQPAKTQIIQGALIGALFLGFVGFNVGFIKGGPGNSSQDHRSDPPPAEHPLQIKVEYRWHLPLAALGCLGEAFLGAVVGAALVALARRRFGERGGTIAVILVGGLGGALLGYSVGGLCRRGASCGVYSPFIRPRQCHHNGRPEHCGRLGSSRSWGSDRQPCWPRYECMVSRPPVARKRPSSRNRSATETTMPCLIRALQLTGT